MGKRESTETSRSIEAVDELLEIIERLLDENLEHMTEEELYEKMMSIDEIVDEVLNGLHLMSTHNAVIL